MTTVNEIEKDEEQAEIYEIGFHIIPSISEENVSKTFADIKSIVEKEGGSFIAEDVPKSKALAYALTHVFGGSRQKFTSAYFGWVKFELAAPNIKNVKSALGADERIIRFLIIKTVRESTLSVARPIHRAEERRERKVEAPKGPVNEVELDKQIEELVKA
ncbi:MAG TPA: 30S ribosomal protein S6 [Candidatus Paceibacterota bacterium]